nr:protein kinase, ATP binding site-containing protein [Tanacetum cinerariifolium]
MSLTREFQHLRIPLADILSATENFHDSNCIGKGGFGKVYKGDLLHSEGFRKVAVKRLDRAFGQGDPEFWKEIMLLSRYQHENIVSLLGFCDERNEKILVFEDRGERPSMAELVKDLEISLQYQVEYEYEKEHGYPRRREEETDSDTGEN